MTTTEPAPREHRPGLHVPAWVVGVIAGLALLVVGFAVGRAANDDGHHGPGRGFGRNGGDFGNGGHGIRILLFLALVAVLVVAVVALVRRFAATPHASSQAERLLADRLARGEISEAEYRSRRDALRG
jgi:putative membrane protein